MHLCAVALCESPRSVIVCRCLGAFECTRVWILGCKPQDLFMCPSSCVVRPVSVPGLPVGGHWVRHWWGTVSRAALWETPTVPKTTPRSPALLTGPPARSSFSPLHATGSLSPLKTWDPWLPLTLGPCPVGQVFFRIFLVQPGLSDSFSPSLSSPLLAKASVYWEKKQAINSY